MNTLHKTILSYLLYCLLIVSTQALTHHSLIRLSAQTVGIYNHTVAIAPSNAFLSGTSFSVTGSVINTGSTVFSNNVHVNLAIDTSSTSTPKFAWRSTTTYSVTSFAPNQTFTFSVSDTGNGTNGYKTNGNGTTIIIWPIVASITNTASVSDSAYSIVYVILPNSLAEVEAFEREVIHIQNPVQSVILLNMCKLSGAELLSLELLSENGQTIMKRELEIVNSSTHTLTFEFETSKLLSGLYYLRFYTKAQQCITKKIVILN